MTAYLVFGRTEFEAPLAQQGTLDADDAASAREAARERFGDGWVELTLVPTEDVRWIVGPDPADDPEDGAEEDGS